MRAADLFGPFLDTLRTQRLRTALTVLGITWGTTAVVVLLAFGVGLAAQMKKNAKGIGDGVVILFGGTTTKTFKGFPEGRRIRLTADDADAVRREVRGLDVVTPEYGRWDTPVRNGTHVGSPLVSGVEPAFGDLRNVIPETGGRFIDGPDLEGRRRVAVLGDELKTLLFGDAPAVGKQVLVGGTPFTVIGVMRKKIQNSSYSQRDKDRIFIPATTFRSVFGERHVSQVLFRVTDAAQGERIKQEVYGILGRRYTFDATDHDAIRMWDTNEQMKFFNALFLGFNLFLGVVGSFTLVVGGIGVANIMYVVVRERTKEIGVRRALGATRRSILTQILLETFVIVAVGAVLGVLVSFGLVAAASLIPMQDEVGTPTISPLVMIATLALLGLIAFLSGLFPARRAANLDPVECLRYTG
jgi:putative ABC transport system permease protein